MNPDAIRKQAQEAVLAQYGLFKVAYRRPLGAALGALGGAAAGYYTAPDDASDTRKVLQTAAGGLGGGLLGYHVAGPPRPSAMDDIQSALERQVQASKANLKKTQEAAAALKAANSPERRRQIAEDLAKGFGMSDEQMHKALLDPNHVWEF